MLTDIERTFLEDYYKACHTSDSVDWMRAALTAKQLYNAKRLPENREEEMAIRAKVEAANP